MWLQLMKRLQIIIWLLLTFHLTSLYSTTITTFSSIAPTTATATANQPTTTARIMSSTTPSTFSSPNHNKRLHLQLQHHQYQQQQYPPLPYQNYPFSGVSHMATEFMETSKKSINKQGSIAVPFGNYIKSRGFGSGGWCHNLRYIVCCDCNTDGCNYDNVWSVGSAFNIKSTTYFVILMILNLSICTFGL